MKEFSFRSISSIYNSKNMMIVIGSELSEESGVSLSDSNHSWSDLKIEEILNIATFKK